MIIMEGPKVRCEKVSITMPWGLLEEIDSLVGDSYFSRSDAICDLVREELRNRKARMNG
jgi:metal-responsive CopG/Arc/MetJ family transcriptional regulator